MKILHVTPHYPAWHVGGVPRAISSLCRELARLGHELTVFTTNNGIDREMQVPVNKPMEVDGVKVTYFQTDFSFKFAYSRALGQACRNATKKFDIVHLSGVWQYPDLPGGYFARKNSIPYVISMSGMFLPAGLQKSRLKKWLYMVLIGYRNFLNAQAIQYTARVERNSAPYPLSRIPSFIIGNGFDLSEFENLPDRSWARKHFAIPEAAFLGVFLGRIERIKNLGNLIEALALAHRKGCNGHLIIAGPDCGKLGDLKARVSSLDLGKYVQFPGYLDPEKRNLLYSAADYVVLPSLQENFGIAAAEGMAAGRPALVSDKVGIAQEVEADRAGLVVKIDAESISQGIIKLAREAEMMEEMGKNAHQGARQRFDIKTVAGKMALAYRDILDGTRSPELHWSPGVQHTKLKAKILGVLLRSSIN